MKLLMKRTAGNLRLDLSSSIVTEVESRHPVGFCCRVVFNAFEFLFSRFNSIFAKKIAKAALFSETSPRRRQIPSTYVHLHLLRQWRRTESAFETSF
jgi:hypothetical protein